MGENKLKKTDNSFYSQLIRYLSDKPLVLDFITRLTITFGVVLIIGGLYLMVDNPDLSVSAQSQGSQSIVAAVGMVPGVPFLMSDLTGFGAVTVGSVTWILGVNLLLVGLGLWVRHKFARLAALLIFSIAAFFQLVEFLTFGIFGSPLSLVGLSVDAVFAYFLFRYKA